MHPADTRPAQLAVFDAPQPFAAPSELAAYMAEPVLVTAGYGVFLAGVILLWPAVTTLAQIIAVGSPRLAWWGGTLLVLGLFARAYYAGADHTAFQLTEVQGLQPATDAVMAEYVDISYGPWRVPVTAAFGLYLGPLLLVIGAYRSATFGLGRTLLLWSLTLWSGVLKESNWWDAVSGAVLCLVLVPLGVQVLRDRLPQLTTLKVPSAGAERRRRGWLSW